MPGEPPCCQLTSLLACGRRQCKECAAAAAKGAPPPPADLQAPGPSSQALYVAPPDLPGASALAPALSGPVHNVLGGAMPSAPLVAGSLAAALTPGRQQEAVGGGA